MKDHRFYALLCTLAITGQLTPGEWVKLEEHCLYCSACRAQLQEMNFLGKQLQLEAAMHIAPVSMPKGSLERFRARAVREGIVPRSALSKSSTSYAMATVAATFVVLAALVFMPYGRRDAEHFANATMDQIPTPQRLSASLSAQTRVLRQARFVRTNARQRIVVPHRTSQRNDVDVTAKPFPPVILASYPFLGSQSAVTLSTTRYSTLSRAQISHLELFHNLDESTGRSTSGIATTRPIDIASMGNVFDFSANIRQLHFQLSSIQ